MSVLHKNNKVILAYYRLWKTGLTLHYREFYFPYHLCYIKSTNSYFTKGYLHRICR